MALSPLFTNIYGWWQCGRVGGNSGSFGGSGGKLGGRLHPLLYIDFSVLTAFEWWQWGQVSGRLAAGCTH